MKEDDYVDLLGRAKSFARKWSAKFLRGNFPLPTALKLSSSSCYEATRKGGGFRAAVMGFADGCEDG